MWHILAIHQSKSNVAMCNISKQCGSVAYQIQDL
jgi:hypothetical protein